MRIISGKYKGRKLKSSNNFEIRPTTDRVKEFIFNVLQDFAQDKIVADIFSGSGNLGLEALSRGARKVIFVDSSAASMVVLRENIKHLKIPEEQYQIIRQDAVTFARANLPGIDLFLLDPPFVYPPIQELLDTLFVSKAMSANSLLVLEHEASNPILEKSDYYQIIKQRTFGRSIISFLNQRGTNEPQ